MTADLKRAFINFLTRLNSKKWADTKSLKVLIQTNRYFTESLWQCVFLKKKILEGKEMDIKFTSSKITFINLFPEADICFSFGLSKYLPIKDSGPKLIYFATAGTESLVGRAIPGDITIVSSSGISSQAIAEYVLGMVLQLHHLLHFTFRNRIFRKWRQQEIVNRHFEPISSKNIGILGFGRNGQCISDIFTRIGCKVSVCDADMTKNDSKSDFYHIKEIDLFLSKIDILVLALTLNEATEGLIDTEKLMKLKPGCMVVNISRGAIIDEKALIKAISEGQINGAVLDVFKKEPLPFFHKLWSIRNILITPHIAGNINIFREEIMEDFANHIRSRI